jgi:putative FmdB family regulatory protein
MRDRCREALMPFYSYECSRCGTFTEMRPMADAGKAVRCPTCKRPAPRAFVQAPFVASAVGADGGKSAGGSRGHGGGCACCT